MNEKMEHVLIALFRERFDFEQNIFLLTNKYHLVRLFKGYYIC